MNFKEQCQELEKGCRKIDVYDKELRNDLICGNNKQNNELCKECLAKAQALQIAGQDFLDYLTIQMADFMNLNGTCWRIMNKKINEIKQGLEILGRILGQ